MAIGIGRMIGFRFPENFNNPYISGSITEFWRRWHITLGRFMRDYLYIPLGGNRVSPSRMYLNLWVVFLISGLWHGADWNFVIWGIFHGLFLVLDRLFLLKFFKWTGKIPAVLITFLITLIGWVFFRSETLSYGIGYLEAMFGGGIEMIEPVQPIKFYTILFFAVVFSFVALVPGTERFQSRIFGENRRMKDLAAMTAFSIIFFMICLGAIISSGFNPFIYFRF
jgi:alginate O-acetyltransferase complex protein AlgI